MFTKILVNLELANWENMELANWEVAKYNLVNSVLGKTFQQDLTYRYSRSQPRYLSSGEATPF